MNNNEETDREKTMFEVEDIEKPTVFPRSFIAKSSVPVSTKRETADCRRILLQKYLDSCRESSESIDCKKECSLDDNCSVSSLDVSVSEFDSEEVESNNSDSQDDESDSEITNVSSLPSNYNSPMPTSPKFVRYVPISERTLKVSNGVSTRTKIPCKKGFDIEQLRLAISEIDAHGKSKRGTNGRKSLPDHYVSENQNHHSGLMEKSKSRDPLSERSKPNKLTGSSTGKLKSNGYKQHTILTNRTMKQKKMEDDNSTGQKKGQKLSKGAKRAPNHGSSAVPHSHSTSCASKLPTPPTFNRTLKHSLSAEEPNARIDAPLAQDVQQTIGLLKNTSTTNLISKAARPCSGPKNGMNKLNGKMAEKVFCPS